LPLRLISWSPRLMPPPVIDDRQELIVDPHSERETTTDVTTNRHRVTPTTRTGIVAWAISQAIQIIVTVLLVAISAAVFVVAIGVFVARTLPKFERVPRSPEPGPHETAMHLIHEPISVEEDKVIVAELNPAIDFERYGGKPAPRWERSRMANAPVPEDDPPW
jgi:hypothetical protein